MRRPPLTLVSQTPWVTPAQPWFNLALGIGASEGSASGLHVSLTFYGRLDDASQLQQSIGGTPRATVLLRRARRPRQAASHRGPDRVGVRDRGARWRRDSAGDRYRRLPAGQPARSTSAARPDTGRCGDVYPVVGGARAPGLDHPVARFTTFLTYQEPGARSVEGGPLRVGVVVPGRRPAAHRPSPTP